MKILSHRGYWRDPREKNSVAAFARSVEMNFGLETDVRDCAGQLVVSHDMPSGNEMRFDRVGALFRGRDLPLAVNIKADGLAASLGNAMSAYDVRNWFAFDMSIPDMRVYLDAKLPVFARVSEVEQEPAWLEEIAGIWLDSFDVNGYDIHRISGFLNLGKAVCVVSPELHRWPYEPLWRSIRHLHEHAGFMLCTDYPEEASRFFTTA